MKQCMPILWLLSVSYLAYAGGDPAAGKTASVLCAGCHNHDGNSTQPAYPKLAGQHETYLTKQLVDFHSGARTEDHMDAMVLAVAKTDFPNLAAYYARQARRTGSQPPADDRGRLLYEQGIRTKGVAACTTCHGRRGEGDATARYPALAGQHAAYIDKMLKAFRSATRRNDPAGVMRMIARKLEDKEIAALAAYLAGLQ